MLYIKKRQPSVKIRTELRNATRSPAWKKIDPTDTDTLRDYFNDLTIKDDLRESLCNEQHHICAYCMRRIEPANVRSVKIEHFVPLSKDKDKVLDYTNYFLCCDGDSEAEITSDTKRILCCDSSKGNKPIELDPRNSIQMEHIRYNQYGKIYYSDINQVELAKKRNEEINEVLQLNGLWDKKEERTIADTATCIVSSRRATYQAAVSYIQRLEKRMKPYEICEVLNDKIESLENTEVYEEFIGVTLFVLKRKLRQLN